MEAHDEDLAEHIRNAVHRYLADNDYDCESEEDPESFGVRSPLEKINCESEEGQENFVVPSHLEKMSQASPAPMVSSESLPSAAVSCASLPCDAASSARGIQECPKNQLHSDTSPFNAQTATQRGSVSPKMLHELAKKCSSTCVQLQNASQLLENRESPTFSCASVPCETTSSAPDANQPFGSITSASTSTAQAEQQKPNAQSARACFSERRVKLLQSYLNAEPSPTYYDGLSQTRHRIDYIGATDPLYQLPSNPQVHPDTFFGNEEDAIQALHKNQLHLGTSPFNAQAAAQRSSVGACLQLQNASPLPKNRKSSRVVEQSQATLPISCVPPGLLTPVYMSQPLWSDGIPFDVRLVVDDGELLSNRYFLSCRSVVFKSMLEGMDKFNSSGPLPALHLREMSVETLRHVLEYIYTDTCKLNVETITEIDIGAILALFDAAERYCVSGLRTHIYEEFLSPLIDVLPLVVNRLGQQLQDARGTVGQSVWRQAITEINSGAPSERGKEVDAFVKIKPCAPSEPRNEKDYSEVEALRLQLDIARREAEETRRLAAENERLRSEMQALAQLQTDSNAQAFEAPVIPTASCLASAASIASSVAAIRFPGVYGMQADSFGQPSDLRNTYDVEHIKASCLACADEYCRSQSAREISNLVSEVQSQPQRQGASSHGFGAADAKSFLGQPIERILSHEMAHRALQHAHRDKPWQAEIHTLDVDSAPMLEPMRTGSLHGGSDGKQPAHPPQLGANRSDKLHAEEKSNTRVCSTSAVNASKDSDKTIDNIDPEPTTMMIRNIPYEMTQKELIDHVNRSGFARTYDFLYIPQVIGSKPSGPGLGYAFINFLDANTASSFLQQWNNTCRFNTKMLSVTPSEKQGLEPNLQHWLKKGRRIRNRESKPFVSVDGNYVLPTCRGEKFFQELDRRMPQFSKGGKGESTANGDANVPESRIDDTFADS